MTNFVVAKLVEKRIVQRKGEWCVVSEDGRKNLGCGPSKGWAEKRLQQVEYFKHAKSLTEDVIAQLLDDGQLIVSDAVLKSFLAKHELVGEAAQHDHTQIDAGDADTVEADVEGEEENYDKSDVATHKDTGVVTESELAQRPRDVRGRSAGYSDDAQAADDDAIETGDAHVGLARRQYEEANALFAKHLPGKHNQQDHAGAKGAAGKVAHTPSQLTDAAARQVAKDEGISIAAAKKKVTQGAKVPTAKRVLSHSDQDIERRQGDPEYYKQKYTPIPKDLKQYAISRGFDPMELPLEWDTMDVDKMKLYPITRLILDWRKKNKSKVDAEAVIKADQGCLKSIWAEYYKYYSGKYIVAGWQAYQTKNYQRAALAFAKARDGFQSDKNPKEFECLDAWRQDAEDKQGKG